MTALPGKQWIFPTKTWRKTLSLILWGLLLLLWNPVHAGNDTKGQLANAQAAVRLAVDRYGPHSVETIPARMALAELHIAEGDFPKAEPLLQQALNISLRANGAEHKSQLPILERLAWIDIRNNRFSSGKQFYADAIEIARKVHGTNSPVMQKLIDSLADARQKERVAGTLTNVRRKQTPPSQESTSPAYDLVIASQDQPPPVAALLLPTVPPAGADSKDKSVGHPPTAKDTKAPDSSAVATAPTAPSSAKASPSQEPSIPAAPPSNSPFLFGVSTPQPVTWKADPATGSQPKPQPTTPTTSVTTAPTVATTVPTAPVVATKPTAPIVAATTTASVPPVPPPPPPQTARDTPSSPPQANKNEADASVKRTGWFISLGCFSESANTEEQLAIVRKLGLPVYTKPQRNGVLTCVYSGPYSESATAETAKKDLLKQKGISEAVIRPYT